MKCPNCNKEMRDNSYWYNCLDGLDSNCLDTLHQEYWCHYCRIRFVNGYWDIPQHLVATEKQLKIGILIKHNTGIDMPPPIKKLMWQYINNNIDLSRNIALSKQEYEKDANEQEQSFYEWREANSH